MTLFVPPRSTGFVSAEDGHVRLRQIVLPISHVSQPQSVIRAVCGLLQLVQAPQASCTVLHVGTHDGMPTLTLPHELGCSWTQIVQPGDIADRILEHATDRAADLIAMSTHGHKEFLDGIFRRSIRGRVVREAPCPVLTIPVLP